MELKGIQLLILCLAVCIFDGQARAPKKIQNGELAMEDELPYQVKLKSGKVLCGGSIISKDWILTAAHCVRDENDVYQPENITVIAGLTDLRKNSTPNAVSKVIVHPAWDLMNYLTEKFVGDIALLKLAEPLHLDSHRRVIRLPESSSAYPVPGTEAIVSGWGVLLDGDKKGVDDLRKLKTTVISLEECRKHNEYGDKVSTAVICTRGKSQNSGFCDGDSGGPLVANGRIIGIVSLTDGCGKKYGDIFTNVQFYNDWILSYIGSQD